MTISNLLNCLYSITFLCCSPFLLYCCNNSITPRGTLTFDLLSLHLFMPSLHTVRQKQLKLQGAPVPVLFLYFLVSRFWSLRMLVGGQLYVTMRKRLPDIDEQVCMRSLYCGVMDRNLCMPTCAITLM